MFYLLKEDLRSLPENSFVNERLKSSEKSGLPENISLMTYEIQSNWFYQNKHPKTHTMLCKTCLERFLVNLKSP